MSQENVEIVREMLDAFNRGDYTAARSALAPDVEWHVPPGVSIGEEVYRGHDAVQEGFALWLGAWETYRFEPTEILDRGDHVVVIGNQRGRGCGSGVEVKLQTFHVITLRNSEVIRMRNFDDRDAALESPQTVGLALTTRSGTRMKSGPFADFRMDDRVGPRPLERSPMHAVIVSVTIHDGEEATKYLRGEIVPRVKQAPGFVAGYWVRVDNGDQGRGTIVFESEDAARAVAEQIQQNPGSAVTLGDVAVGEVVESA